MVEGADRVTVTTYVSEHQREVWRDDAESMDMSQSEFVRTMVQAGRRGFDLDTDAPTDPERHHTDETPGVSGLESALLDALDRKGPLEWGPLVEYLTADFEDRLEAALESLDEDGTVDHNGPQGGYYLTEGDHGE